MKTAISIPDDLFAQVEAVIKEAGMSRSEFYREAARSYAAQLASADLTARIDAYIERTGDDGTDSDWTDWSRAHLAQATEADEW
ncbi:MAG: ribbon-helix-helix protein, CopG family [Bifidobacteriaceae bacterium]|jgi:metal-responsive CopG/Arc/MetJ family transcriptional regulator|nr:ribbon-helix-helix protein, CopG family [Bifidobacteriaceae bacterium]